MILESNWFNYIQAISRFIRVSVCVCVLADSQSEHGKCEPLQEFAGNSHLNRQNS